MRFDPPMVPSFKRSVGGVEDDVSNGRANDLKSWRNLGLAPEDMGSPTAWLTSLVCIK